MSDEQITTDDLIHQVKLLWDAVAATQIVAIPVKHLVAEMLIDLAHHYEDKEKYLASLFDRVTSAMEREAEQMDRSQGRVQGEGRALLEFLFAAASIRLRSGFQEGPPSS